MSDTVPLHFNPPDDANASPAEILMTRIVDGQASAEDRERFEALADRDPALWRSLAMRQQDMHVLVQHVEPLLNRAEAIALPEDAPLQRAALAPRWALKLGMISGWAAVLALSAALAVMVLKPHAPPSRALPATDRRAELTPDDHLREYLQAPFVVAELPATVLQVEDMSDGRLAVRILRRIEEIIFIDSPESLPIGEDGNLTAEPAKLRDSDNSEF